MDKFINFKMIKGNSYYKRIIFIVVMLLNLLVLSSCLSEHYHEVIQIDGLSPYKIEENSKFIYLSNFYHELYRFDKINKEEIKIDLDYDFFTVSDNNIYYSKDKIIKKCDLNGNIILERTMNDNIEGLVFDKGYLYFILTKNKDDIERQIFYLNENDLLGDINSSDKIAHRTTIKINDSYLFWYENLYCYKNDVAYGYKNSVHYIYHGEENVDIDNIEWPQLKEKERRSYIIKVKVYEDDLYISSFAYSIKEELEPTYICYDQYREYTLAKYNFITQETEILFNSLIGDIIINFNQEYVYLYRSGKILSINLENKEQKQLGEIAEIIINEDVDGYDERIFLTTDNMIIHIYPLFSNVHDIIYIS